jgi:hypothetical protein
VAWSCHRVGARSRAQYVKRLNSVAPPPSYRRHTTGLYSTPPALEVRILEVRLFPADLRDRRGIWPLRRVIAYHSPSYASWWPTRNRFIYHYENWVCDIHHPHRGAELEATSLHGPVHGNGAQLFQSAVTYPSIRNDERGRGGARYSGPDGRPPGPFLSEPMYFNVLKTAPGVGACFGSGRSDQLTFKTSTASPRRRKGASKMDGPSIRMEGKWE